MKQSGIGRRCFLAIWTCASSLARYDDLATINPAKERAHHKCIGLECVDCLKPSLEQIFTANVSRRLCLWGEEEFTSLI